MTNSSEVSSNTRLRNVAVILASLIIALPLLTGQMVEAFLDSTNPDGLADVTVGLAYLRPILIATFAVLGAIVVAFIIATSMLYRRERSAKAISLPLIVGIIQLVIGVLIIVATQVIGGAAG